MPVPEMRRQIRRVVNAAGAPRATLIAPEEWDKMVQKYHVELSRHEAKELGRRVFEAMPDSVRVPIKVPVLPGMVYDGVRRPEINKTLVVCRSEEVIAERQAARNVFYGVLGVENPWLEPGLEPGENPDFDIWGEDEYVTGVNIGRSHTEMGAGIIVQAGVLLETGAVKVPELQTLSAVPPGHLYDS